MIQEKVLVYAQKTMEQNPCYWPKIAMEECLKMGVRSSYYRYLRNIKESLDAFGLNKRQIKATVHQAAINYVVEQQKAVWTSTFAMSKPSLGGRYKWFKLKSWLNDTPRCKIFNTFRICNAGLGNRGPTKNGQIHKLCPLCIKKGTLAINNEVYEISKAYTQYMSNKFRFTC